jgi:hypothetical protein
MNINFTAPKSSICISRNHPKSEETENLTINKNEEPNFAANHTRTEEFLFLFQIT